MLVAVGVILNQQDEVLISKRPLGTYQAGLWELPGGKVESGESTLEALQRELFEEIGIVVTDAKPWIQVPFVYSDREVLLDTWEVTKYTGEPYGKEGQMIRWVNISLLNQFDLPEGNEVIIKKLKDLQK